MDGLATLHQNEPSSSNGPAGQFMHNGAMVPQYNGLLPPNYFNNPMPHMPPQHRPDMPSTSNGPLPSLHFQPQAQVFPSPMDVPNGSFYTNQITSLSGMMPAYNGIPPPNYFNGPMHPNLNGPMPPNLTGIPSTMPSMTNGLPPPDYPQMLPRASSSGAPARASPFGQPTMHAMPNSNGTLTPTYGMPAISKTPGLFMPGVEMSTANNYSGFVFTTEMANQAATEVSQGKQQSIAQWHKQQNGLIGQGANTNAARKTGARNSPSYATASQNRKRKASQAQERQNPTPSPQLTHPPGSVPDFKQPMSNHAPNSVPDASMMQQYGLDAHKQIKTDPMTQIKSDPIMPSTADHNPLKQMELMAKQTENSSLAHKLGDPQADPNLAVKQPNDKNKAEKLARLALIQKKIGMDGDQPQYPPQMYGNVPPRFMPPNGLMMPNQPPMYYNAPNSMPPNGMPLNGMPPNGMPPNGMPPNGIPPNGIQSNGMQPNGMPPNGMPPNGMPPNGMPPNGMPPNGMPPNGMPPNGMPPNGMPPNGMLPNGLSANGMPLNGYSSMEMNNPGMAGGPQNFPHQIPPSYISPGQRFPIMSQPNGVMPNNNMRMPYSSMDMSMARPPGPEMFSQWQENMPQPLTNLDSRVPSQKINYYGNGNGQPQSMSQMPSISSTSALKNGGCHDKS